MSREKQDARGNPGKRAKGAYRSEKEAEEGTSALAPLCVENPPWLPEQARPVWNRAITELNKLGFVRESDRVLLAAYALTVSQYHEVSERLALAGFVYETDGASGKMLRPNPLFQMQRALLRQMQALGRELGLSPAARTELLEKMASAGGVKLGARPLNPDPLHETEAEEDPMAHFTRPVKH